MNHEDETDHEEIAANQREFGAPAEIRVSGFYDTGRTPVVLSVDIRTQPAQQPDTLELRVTVEVLVPDPRAMPASVIQAKIMRALVGCWE